jgi:hypothetical protein
LPQLGRAIAPGVGPFAKARGLGAGLAAWLDTPSALPYLTTCLGVAALLAARVPGYLAHPLIEWDDAAFLTQGLSHPLSQTLLAPVVGYVHLIPRLVAAAFTPFNVLHAPLWFSIVSLAFVSAALAMPVSHHFGHLLPPAGRLSIVLATTLMPWHSEIMANVASIHFIVFYAAALAVFLPFERLGWTARGAFLLLAAAAASSPLCVTLLPLLLLRVARLRGGLRARLWPALLIMAIVLQLVLVRSLVTPDPAGSVSRPLSARTSGGLLFLDKAIGYKVVLLTACGQAFSERSLQGHVASAAGVALLLPLLVTAVVARTRAIAWREAVGPPLACLYLIVVPVAAMGYLRPEYVAHFGKQDAYYGADRYFVAPAFFAITLAVVALSRLVGRWPRTRWAAWMVAVAFSCVVVANFRYMPLPDDAWREQIGLYYRLLVRRPSGETPGQGTFRVDTFPGGGWYYCVELPLFQPTSRQRARLLALLERLPRGRVLAENVHVSEGDARGAIVRVSLRRSLPMAVALPWATRDITARGGHDYARQSGFLRFEPGTTTGEVTVPLRDDRLVSPDRAFAVDVWDPSGAHEPATATITIAEDDFRVERFSIDPPVAKCPGQATLTWNVPGARRVRITGVPGRRPAAGSVAFEFRETMEFALTAVAEGGARAEAVAKLTLLDRPSLRCP